MTNSESKTSSWSLLLRRYRAELTLILAVVAVVLLTICLDKNRTYLNKPQDSLYELLRHASMLGILALGASVVIISGGIDLSAGSVIAFSGTICASLIQALAPVDARGIPITTGLPWWVFVLAFSGTMVSAFLIGSLHTWLITVVRLPPFVATLASLVGLRSFARVLISNVTHAISGQENSQIYLYDDFFLRLGDDWRIPVIIFAVLAFVTWVLLSLTVTGRHLYAMGGNEAAARLSGIRTERLKWLAYCYGSMTAAISGILYTSYTSAADPTTMGIGYELDAIAAAVVGGCSLAGGIGTVTGVALGALFLRSVIDAVNKTVTFKPDEYQGLIVGLLVVLAVTLNEFRNKTGSVRRIFPGRLGVVTWLNLTLLSGVLAMVIVSSHKLATGAITASIIGVLLGTLAIWEQRRLR